MDILTVLQLMDIAAIIGAAITITFGTERQRKIAKMVMCFTVIVCWLFLMFKGSVWA